MLKPVKSPVPGTKYGGIFSTQFIDVTQIKLVSWMSKVFMIVNVSSLQSSCKSFNFILIRSSVFKTFCLALQSSFRCACSWENTSIALRKCKGTERRNVERVERKTLRNAARANDDWESLNNWFDLIFSTWSELISCEEKKIFVHCCSSVNELTEKGEAFWL